jgi:hypothetical protein
MSQEKQFVKFTRNSCAESQGYSIGDIAAFSAKTCADLISARAAEPFTPPVKAERETAALAPTEKASFPNDKKTKK